MKIVTYRGPTHHSANGFIAVTSEYDGAPDAHRVYRTCGMGLTEAEALADLQEQLEMCEESLEGNLRECALEMIALVKAKQEA
jgi:hypothetical protein